MRLIYIDNAADRTEFEVTFYVSKTEYFNSYGNPVDSLVFREV